MARLASLSVVLGLLSVFAASGVHAHGYLTYPPPRGIEKAATSVDSLKSPNAGGAKCRGETFTTGVTKVTPVSRSITLATMITAPHVGPCKVSIMNPDNSGERLIAEKMNCASTEKYMEPWTITIPADITGRKVLRWQWQGCHVQPCEAYEQCSDIIVGGGAGGGSGDDGYSTTPKPPTTTQPPTEPTAPTEPGTGPIKAYDTKPSTNPTTPNGDVYEEGKEKPAYPTTPDPSKPTAPAPPTNSPGADGCENGKFSCDTGSPSKYKQCSNGAWATFDCPSTLKCSLDATIGMQCVSDKVY